MSEQIKTVNEKVIKNWPKDDRPREKLLKHGEHTLSNAELLAILLRTGTKGASALDLSRKILQKFKTFRDMGHTDSAQWKDLKGLGNAKLAQIRAAIEIGRRFGEEKLAEKMKVSSAQDIIDLLMPRMRDLKKEVFKVVLLNSQNQIIEILEITQGTVNQAAPIIREIFQKALQYFSASIVCVHNHPSGNTQPSKEDRSFTQELIKAGNILQVKVLDHLIIGDGCWQSVLD
ncbi:MAG: DNA repair protein RadC [Candidatus Omnitrophica bacterium]|nr:DNA repair protein RadC [Candidatus Omnitrophota bacterium]